MSLIPEEMTPAYIGLLAGVTILNTLIALLVLLAGKGPIGLVRVGLTAAVVCILALVEIVALVVYGLSMFGVIHVAWQHAAIVIPTTGLGLLIGTRKSKRAAGSAQAVALLALLAYPVAGWAWFVEPKRLVLEEATLHVSTSRVGSAPIKVGVLADIQTRVVGDHEREAVRRLMAEEPDLILLPGDVYHGPVEGLEEQIPALQDLLSRLSAPGGVFIVTGNTDIAGKRGLPRIIEGTEVRILDDELVKIDIEGRSVTLLGLSEHGGGPRLQPMHELERLPGDDDIRIVLVHRPDPVLHLARDSRVDLVVAGHTHGGQVTLPLFGPPLTLTDVPRHIAAGGLWKLDGRSIYVSRGVGLERLQAPRIRFLCPPEISVVTLEASGL